MDIVDNKLHRIDPDKVVFNTLKIDDIKLSKEQCAIIKKNLIHILEKQSNLGDDGEDFQECEEIKIVGIVNYPTDSSKVCLEIKIMYDCPIEGHCTPDITDTFHIWLDKEI